ncbi:MAG: HAD family hydrolase [Bdellovibrionia bacterium]
MAKFLDESKANQVFTRNAYKMVLFDLDGTLLKECREISAKNLITLTRLMNEGIKVGFATGRTLKSVQPFIDVLKPNGPLILFNGARVWDSASNSFVFEKNLSFEQAYCAMKLVREFEDVHVNLYVDNEIYISKKTDRSRESEIKDGVPHNVVGDLADWLESRFFAANKAASHATAARASTPTKIMLISEPAILDVFETEFRARAYEPASLIHSEWNYLEIMQSGINKGLTLQKIESHYGIRCSEIISFGDNLNDIDLIKLSGLGIAMANSHGDLKAIANETIGHHETDTIHEFLSEIFPE